MYPQSGHGPLSTQYQIPPAQRGWRTGQFDQRAGTRCEDIWETSDREHELIRTGKRRRLNGIQSPDGSLRLPAAAAWLLQAGSWFLDLS